MSKRDDYIHKLLPLFDAHIATGDDEELLDYLTSNSNLPGPRGNLELAEAFGDATAQCAAHDKLHHLCQTMTQVSADEAPAGDPREFIPFCGTVGIGALGAASPTLFDKAMTALRALANDTRWRMREAVPMALQRLTATHRQEVLNALEQWATEGSLLQMRAAAAGVAEPALLKDSATARAALELHETILERVSELDNRKSDEFRALRKGLGYTLSIVVRALPEEGFAFMHQLAATQDKDVLWIVKQNLKKNRLVKNHPIQVEETRSSLQERRNG